MRGNILFLLGLFSLFSTLNQGPTYVLAALGGRGYEKRPKDITGRPMLLRPPSFSRIPEEGTATKRWDENTRKLVNRVLAGSGPAPLTGFAHHRPQHPLPPGRRQGFWPRSPANPSHF
uniref:Uncharacterized protein n=1 Tax=Rhipicephalus appendiculatus TaxID=34631 RepID=A0A131YHB8_RHIAP